jgi:hypothetical protein
LYFDCFDNFSFSKCRGKTIPFFSALQLNHLVTLSFFTAKAARNEMINYLLTDHIVSALLDRSLLDSDVEELHQLLYLLFNDETTKVILKLPREEFWYGPRNRVKPMLEQISANAPNLQELEISRYERQMLDMSKYDHRIRPKHPFKDITKPWTRLKYFKLHFWNCTDQDVNLLADIVPNVVRLDVC